MTAPDFNEDLHQYTLAGRVLPSVTQILTGMGMLKDLSFLDPFYRQRGTATHKVVDLDFSGLEIDWDFAGAEHVLPRYEKFLRLKEAAKLRPILWETPLASETWQYAGMPDYAGRFFQHLLAIVDWKGDGVEPGHRLQVAGGYRGLLIEAARAGDLDVDPVELMHCPCFLVPLGGNGEMPRHHLVEDEDGAALNIFRGAAAVWNWRAANSYNNGGKG